MAIQVTGALLDACVLALLTEGDAYGYSLTQSIRETLEVSESTLYPVMRRLQTDDCLTTYDQPHSGRNRRYYKITERGMEKYAACVVEWKMFKQRIDSILLGGDEVEKLIKDENEREDGRGANGREDGGSENVREGGLGENESERGGGNDKE